MGRFKQLFETKIITHPEYDIENLLSDNIKRARLFLNYSENEINKIKNYIINKLQTGEIKTKTTFNVNDLIKNIRNA